MAKKKGRPPTDRDDVSVRIDRILNRKAKELAAHQGVSVAELLSELLRAPIEKAWGVMLRDTEAESRKARGKGADN